MELMVWWSAFSGQSEPGKHFPPFYLAISVLRDQIDLSKLIMQSYSCLLNLPLRGLIFDF